MPQIERSPRRHMISRMLYQKLSGLLIPTHLKQERSGEEIEGIEKARRSLEEGRGVVVIYTHPSRLDTHRLMELWKYPEFAERRCLIPIAYHQFNRVVVATSWPTGVEFYPIVTQETVNKQKNNSKPEGYGSVEFLREVIKALSQGGTILLAPTTTRTSVLSRPPEGKLQPTDALLNAAHTRRVPFSILFTGFEINGATSYENVRGFNIFTNRHYTLHIGRTLTDAEILDEVTNFRRGRDLSEDPKRPYNGTDAWLYETQLPLLVPPAYLPKIL